MVDVVAVLVHFLSEGELKWLRTGLTLEGRTPEEKHLVALRSRIRRKVRTAASEFESIFEHPDFRGLREEVLAKLAGVKITKDEAPLPPMGEDE